MDHNTFLESHSSCPRGLSGTIINKTASMFILHRGWASIGKTYGIMSTYQNFHKRLKKLTLKSKLINILKDFLLTLLTNE